MNNTGETTPRLTEFYLEYRKQHHDIRCLLEKTSQYYSESALIRLTRAKCADTRRAAALLLGFLGTYESNEPLGLLLKDSDRSVRLLAENSLKSVWTRDGSEEHRRELHAVMRHIAGQDYGEAVRRANILLDDYPLFAEAVNQRAIALFALKNFRDAIDDGQFVLELNPYHFGAAVGTGHAYWQLGDKMPAVESFQRALFINPNLDGIRRHLECLTGTRTR
ncbi:MAG: hypothetical protein LBH00_06180 [Planctomycetaceae bacterium]|jgi:tetratricopeptide (TPR) repeat protein|nr:hypothetical protein [Planctomycetaceae bacterium]